MTKALFETEVGNIIIEFFPNDAPNTVNNFTKLISEGFYDGLAFHRVIPADIKDEELALYTRLQELSLSDS